MLSSLRRIISLSLSNLWRNKFLSLATVAVIGIILFIFNIIVLVNFAANSAIKILNQKVGIITYFQNDADNLEINNLINDLKEFPEITDVKYTSKEEALKNILKEYPEGEDPFKKYGLPNKLPANIRIITASPEDHEKIISFLNQGKYQSLLKEIDSNVENQLISKQLIKITSFTKQILFGIIFAFFISSILIILNSIHLAIYNRKKEIQVMKLVGAKYSFIHLPFILEGIFLSLASLAVNIILLDIFLYQTRLDILIQNRDQLFFLILAETAVCLILGIFSSLIAVYKYLK